ncbi:MAG: type IV toxin-antitoxin system AbiEi family antitoxin domain-containing protein [Lachnospiraceae bacterium]|nr:type IV toxin-antitoxin system AbiEi family antitoxin domain-containing protein [Lachnospiraceae bacterium]
MEINPSILETIKKNNNMITTAQAVELGFTRALLSLYVKEGLLERGRRGVYILSDSIHDDMYTLMLRSDKIIFSHDTALFLNGLSERTPFTHSVTIPSNTKLSSSLRDECVCYYIKPELHQVGAIRRKNTLGNEVRCYNAERTICDLLRSRNRLDEETVISAIKNYAVSPDKDLNLLAVYALRFGVDKVIKRYMEVLI